MASSKRQQLVERAVADNGVDGLFLAVLGKESDAQGDKGRKRSRASSSARARARATP